jgi:hypothetical protein
MPITTGEGLASTGAGSCLSNIWGVFRTASLAAAACFAESSAGWKWQRQKYENMERLCSSRFANVAGGVLAATGLAKAFSAIGPARVLDAADPLIGIPFRQLLLLVGLVELFIAFFCLFTDKRRLSLLGVAWLSTNFLVYRLGLWFIGWHHPCACMGSLAGALHLSDQAADNIMKGILAFMLAGSYLLLFSQWRQSLRAVVGVTQAEVPAESLVT